MSEPRTLVLASTSRYRRELLERLGLPFRCIAPGVDEDAVRPAGAAPDAVAQTLARAKAVAVAQVEPDAVVIGSDQVCALDDAVLGKPGTRAAAIEQLAALAGRTHRLITAVAIAHPGGLVEFADVTTLRMRALDRAALAAYVDRDEPWDCAGSYKLEQGGIGLFDSIESADWTAIVGLPLLAVGAALRALGAPAG